MNQEGNPLDLNHFPEDFTRDGKQLYQDTSTSGQRRKKKNGKEESGKVYECRFCSLKFCKSQALGGHMNRHRQERETETLNKARQLVYSSDQNIAAHPLPTLGSSYVVPGPTVYHPPPPSQHHHHHHQVYPTRSLMYSGTHPPSQHYPISHNQSCIYTSSTSPRIFNTGDYNNYVTNHGQAVLARSSSSHSNYTCIGAPINGIHGLGLGLGPARREGLGREDGGLASGSWARSYGPDHQHQHLESPNF